MLQVIELSRSDRLVVVRAVTLIDPTWGDVSEGAGFRRLSRLGTT